MAFRLFRRIKILPGVTLNLSKTGISTSVGVKGAKVTLGKTGVRKTVGIPGTGVSFTEVSGNKQKAPEASRGRAGTLFIVLVVIVFVCWLSFVFFSNIIGH